MREPALPATRKFHLTRGDTMEQVSTHKTAEQTVQAIFALDFEQVKTKLMSKTEGHGWSRAEADRHELEYKRYLALLVKYPDETIAPSMNADKFWHGHILDTMKYAADCKNVFGYFLHHYPYFGMRGEEDAARLKAAGKAMRRLYEQEFGTAKSESEAYCGAASDKADAVAYCGTAAVAYCGAASGPAAQATQEAAYCGTANVSYCGAAAGKEQHAAYCGAVAGKAEATAEAYCGVASVAYCGATSAVAYCGAAVQADGSGEDEVAYCGAAGSTAYCGALSSKLAAGPAEVAYCGAVADRK